MQKKRFQNALAMLLAVVMILGMLPAAVGAVDLAEEPTNEQQASTTAEPEDKGTALPENEPDAEATAEEPTAEPEDKEAALPENESGAEATTEEPTAEPEDKETALPENEPGAEVTGEEPTAEPEDKETALPENEPGAEASAEAPAETTAAQESTEETAAEQPMSFQGRSDSGVRVTAKAPAGAFGTPVTMTVCDARVDATTEAQILSTADGSRVLAAVDITFWDGEGNQVEPQRQITVTISAGALNEAEHLQVVHVDTLESGAVDRSSAPKQISSSSTGGDTVVLVTDEFSIYAVVDADTTESPALLTYSFYEPLQILARYLR